MRRSTDLSLVVSAARPSTSSNRFEFQGREPADSFKSSLKRVSSTKALLPAQASSPSTATKDEIHQAGMAVPIKQEPASQPSMSGFRTALAKTDKIFIDLDDEDALVNSPERKAPRISSLDDPEGVSEFGLSEEEQD